MSLELLGECYKIQLGAKDFCGLVTVKDEIDSITSKASVG
jgi:hypothetical protein